jgi:CO/xanthine dehydrogenase Mo-binding subunit
MTQVGRSLPRLEAEDKVSGTAEYIHNLVLDGMLHGAIVRSTVPHARVTRVDAAAALGVAGVHRVVTSADVLSVTAVPRYGPAFWDQPVLAIDEVRHVGDPVAVVLADTGPAALEAADLVTVGYAELPAVFDEVTAAADDAPLVHERVEASALFADLKGLGDRERTNVSLWYKLRRGQVEDGLAGADFVFEHTFHTPATAHVPMEPLISVAEPGARGSVIVHSATQNPSEVRTELARLLGLPENKVQVRTAFLGGGFGGKLYPRMEPMAAVCALLTGHPVRIALSMDESFVALTRHASTSRLRTGVRQDGTIVARQCETWWNTGAYADIGPRVTQKTGSTAAGPYNIPAVRIDSYNVYTHLPPAGAFRGFGVPQVTWAYESQADIIARALGLDPIEFRRRNLLHSTQLHATGTELRGAGTTEVLDALHRAMRWDQPLHRGDGPVRRGRGVALGIKAVITPSTSGAIVTVHPDGSCSVGCGTVDMGQGSATAFAQLCAEVLGLRAEDVAVGHPDTDITPYDMGTLGSRSTFHMGHAVQAAAASARRQLLDVAAKVLSADPAELTVADGIVTNEMDGRSLSFADIMVSEFGMRAGNIIGTGTYTPDYVKPDPETGQSTNMTAFWMVGGAGAEVSVDTRSGALTVERLVVVADAGRAINPAIVRTQLSGAAIMQLGMTISEELRYEDGQPVNTGLAQYRVPGFMDIPDIEPVIVEVPQENAPFGVKGVGESGTFAVSPAVANAVQDAVGVRVYDLPLTAERIWAALRASGDPEAGK